MENYSFKIILNNTHDLIDEDASLAYGYFEYRSHDHFISFFKKRECMVFITLTSLIDFLSSNIKIGSKFNWVGDGNGSSISVEIISHNKIEFLFNCTQIGLEINCLINSIINFLELYLHECIQINPLIIRESGFIGLENAFKILKKKFY